MSASGWPRGFGFGSGSFTGHVGLDSNHGSTDDLGQALHQAQISQQSHSHRFRSPVLHRVSSLFSLATSSVTTSDHGGQGEEGDETDDGVSTPLPTRLEQITFGDEIRKAPEDMQPVSLLQIVESLQSAMMTRRDHTAGVPPEYNAHIMALIEGFGHVHRRLEKTTSELADLKQVREKELDEFRGLSEEWTRQGNEYKAEIKRLELLLAKESKDGVASVVIARSNTLIDRSGTKSFQARLKRLSSSRDEDDEGDTGSARQVPEKVHFQRTNTKPKTIDNIPRIMDHLSDIRLSRVVRDQDSSEQLQPTDTGLSDHSALSPSHARDAHMPDVEALNTYQPSAEELRERAGRVVDSSSSSGSGRGIGLEDHAVAVQPPAQRGSRLSRGFWGVPSGPVQVAGLGIGAREVPTRQPTRPSTRQPTLFGGKFGAEFGEDTDGPAGRGALTVSGWLMDQHGRPTWQHSSAGPGTSAGNSRLRCGSRRARGFSFKAGDDDVLPTSAITSSENYELADLAGLEALTSHVGASSTLPRAKTFTTTWGSEHVAAPKQDAPATRAAPEAPAATSSTRSTLMPAAKVRQGPTVRRIAQSGSTGSVVYVGRKSTESSGSSQAATQAASGNRITTLRRESERSQTGSPVSLSLSSCGRPAMRASLSPSSAASAKASVGPATSNRSGSASRRGSSWSSAGSWSPAKSSGATEAARIAANVAVARRSQRDSVEK